MNRTHQEKIDLLLKFLKREPKDKDLVPKRKGCLSFLTKDSYKKYCMLDKHIKLVAKCLFEGLITFDNFFNSFERVKVRNYDSQLELFVLFSNSAKMVLYSSPKYREVGWHFFNKFDFTNPLWQDVDIYNQPLVQENFRLFPKKGYLRPKETNLKPMFDFVGD